jgi:regulator of protease activity HflC (stomatin/prohibitin superfamily)
MLPLDITSLPRSQVQQAMPASQAPPQRQMGETEHLLAQAEHDVQANLLCPHPISCLLSSIPCIWPVWCCSCKVINQNEHAAVMSWGKYVGSITSPGIQIINPIGVELRKVSTQRKAIDIKDLKCTDGKGNPIFVSGNIIYRITSAKKAMVDIQNVDRYIVEQSPMVLRRICASHPYESQSGPSLRGHNGTDEDHTVSDALRSHLQHALIDAGVEVLQFQLTDLSYAPEIAAAMLQRQQAEAMVEARQVIVQSAVQIASDAISRMKQLGHANSPAGEERIISNILTVICSERGSQPVLPLASYGSM